MTEKDKIRINYAAARVNRHLTQKEASKGLSISVETLQNYESGKTVPTWDTHQRMADYYLLPPEVLCSPRKQDFILPENSH